MIVPECQQPTRAIKQNNTAVSSSRVSTWANVRSPGRGSQGEVLAVALQPVGDRSISVSGSRHLPLYFAGQGEGQSGETQHPVGRQRGSRAPAARQLRQSKAGRQPPQIILVKSREGQLSPGRGQRNPIGRACFGLHGVFQLLMHAS